MPYDRDMRAWHMPGCTYDYLADVYSDGPTHQSRFVCGKCQGTWHIDCALIRNIECRDCDEHPPEFTPRGAPSRGWLVFLVVLVVPGLVGWLLHAVSNGSLPSWVYPMLFGIGFLTVFLISFIDSKSDSMRHSTSCQCYNRDMRFHCRSCRLWRPACRMDRSTLCIECAV